MAYTEAEIQEAKDTLSDFDTILTSLTELEGKMNSEPGKQFMSEFVGSAVPAIKMLKAQIMVEYSLI